jgi:hypothetical protein
MLLKLTDGRNTQTSGLFPSFSELIASIDMLGP